MHPRILSTFVISALLTTSLLAQTSNTDELKRRAEAGDAKAQNELGVAYRMGDGVARDKQEALKWYLKSAKQGFSDAMFNLGTSYYNGDGVPSDVDMANAWFIIAADHGSAEARSAIERIKAEQPKPSEYMYDRFVGTIYATELAPNEDKAFDWLRKAAKQKNSTAAEELCFRSLKGEGLKKDAAAAATWCDVAGKAGDAKALIALGDIYSRGDGLKLDAKKAVKSYENAVYLRNSEAPLRLASLYLEGSVVKKDVIEAYSWLLLAYALGAKEGRTQMEKLVPQMSEDEINSAKKRAKDHVKQLVRVLH